jgi:hypothetical protein
MPRSKKKSRAQKVTKVSRPALSELEPSAKRSDRVGEVWKFAGSIVLTLIVGLLASLYLMRVEKNLERDASRLRITSEAVGARREALSDFGERIHLITDAHYDALLAEYAWQETISEIGFERAARIETGIMLEFAKRLVGEPPVTADDDRDGTKLAERVYANYLVGRERSVKAGSGQALCVALMSRLRSVDAREAVADLSAAMRALENGEGLPEAQPAPSDDPDAGLSLIANAADPCGTTGAHRLVRRVSDALDNVYREIYHELATESQSIWSEIDDDRAAPRRSERDHAGSLHGERGRPSQGDGPRQRAAGAAAVTQVIGHGPRR